MESTSERPPKQVKTSTLIRVKPEQQQWQWRLQNVQNHCAQHQAKQDETSTLQSGNKEHRANYDGGLGVKHQYPGRARLQQDETAPEPRGHHREDLYNSNSQLLVRGKFKTRIKTTSGATSDEEIYVVEGSRGSLLSWCASQRLDLITATKTLRSLDASTEVDRLPEE